MFYWIVAGLREMWKSMGVETAMHVKANTMLSGKIAIMYYINYDLVYFVKSKHGILTVQISARLGLLIFISTWLHHDKPITLKIH